VVRIAHQGRGPGEYLTISDMSVRGDHLFIYDARVGKVLQYTLAGRWVREVPVKLPSSQFEAMTNGNFVFYCDYLPYALEESGEKSNIVVTDADLKPLAGYLPYDNGPNAEFLMGSRQNINRNGDHLSFFESYGHVLYGVQAEGPVPMFVMDFPADNGSLAEKLFGMTATGGWDLEKTLVFEHDNGFCRILDVQENDTHIVMTYHKSQWYYTVFYEKESGKVVELQKKMSDNAPPISLVNDLDNTLYYPMLAASGDFFFSITDAYQLDGGHIRPDRVSALLDELPADPNPILVKIRMKAF